jgi:hypothetical protein
MEMFMKFLIENKRFRIRDVLHDDRLSWGEKGLLSYRYFFDEDDLGSAVKVSLDDMDKVYNLFEEIEEVDLEDNQYYECDCKVNNKNIYKNIPALHNSFKFVLLNRKLSFSAKGILLFFLLHGHKHIGRTDLLGFSGKSTESTNKTIESGLETLLKLQYIQEEKAGLYKVT